MINLDNYNTENFLFDPKKEKGLNTCIEKGMFKFSAEGLSKVSLCTYIALLYDPESELRKQTTNYPQRKYEAAKLAGLNLKENKEYSELIEDFILGKRKDFNMAIVDYLTRSSFSLDFTILAIKQHAIRKVLSDSMLKYDKNSEALINDMSKDIESRQAKVFGGDEVTAMRDAMYQQGEVIRLNLRPEDIVNKSEKEIIKMGPYGNYKPDKITFAGDGEPTEE